jgi:TonB family protein
MKISSLFLFMFFALVLPTSLGVQEPHVHTRYVKESKTTIVETDLMYIIDTPQQFVQLGFLTRYPTERLEKPPKKIDLLIWSFSKEVLYREVKDHAVKFYTDAESWDASPQLYVVFKGEAKNGQDLFWSEKRPELGQPSPLPNSAQVKIKESINNLFMEQIFVELKPEQLLKVTSAKNVELQIGKTRFRITDEYLSTIRDFNSHLIPGVQSAADINTDQSVTKPSQKSGDLIDLGVVNGRAISLPRPEYSSMARGARAAGSVTVFVTIDETGKVVAARAITGHPLLREASEAAAREARFKPTMVSGQPIKVTGIITYSFVSQ